MTMEEARLYNAEDDLTARTNAAKENMVFDGRADPQVMEIQAQRLSEARETGFRAFVFPTKQFHKELVKAGVEPPPEVVIRNPAQLSRRTGDVFLEVSGGICILDPRQPGFSEKLAWCEEHPELCRDAFDPKTVIWASMKQSQTDTMYKDASLPKNVNVDKLVDGDFSQLLPEDSLVARAQQQLISQSHNLRA